MKIGIPKNGRFGDFGGKYIPETLAPAIEDLEKNYLKIRNDPTFKKELNKFSGPQALNFFFDRTRRTTKPDERRTMTNDEP